MAEKGKQSPLAVAGLILVIVIALSFVIKSAMPKRYRPPDVDWTCEACGYQFVQPSAHSPSKCLQCGKMEAVISAYRDCEKCGTVFEAYRMMEGFIKKPDGEWVKEMSEEGRKVMDELACPNCGNNDRRTLKYSPPTVR